MKVHHSMHYAFCSFPKLLFLVAGCSLWYFLLQRGLCGRIDAVRAKWALNLQNKQCMKWLLCVSDCWELNGKSRKQQQHPTLLSIVRRHRWPLFHHSPQNSQERIRQTPQAGKQGLLWWQWPTLTASVIDYTFVPEVNQLQQVLIPTYLAPS